MSQGKLFEQILNPANRHNPYPLYAQLRKTPISQQEDGTYVVSTYREIESLLYDPRISSDRRKSSVPTDAARRSSSEFSNEILRAACVSSSSTHQITTASVAL
jgi:cytochrome P450